MTVGAITTLPRPAWVFLLPPPAYFGAAFGAGMLVQYIVPFSLADFPGRPPLGFALLLAGIMAGPALAAMFVIRRTTLNPFATPSVLLITGIYRVSRNPMYLSLTLAYLGGWLLFSSLWPLPFLAIPLIILDRVVIPYEEASMRRTFGGAYEAYEARVRRWI